MAVILCSSRTEGVRFVMDNTECSSLIVDPFFDPRSCSIVRLR